MEQEMMEPKGIVGACECSRKWISVDKQLPDPDERVLLYDPIFGMVVSTYPVRAGFVRATHWMPLPKPPKKED